MENILAVKKLEEIFLTLNVSDIPKQDAEWFASWLCYAIPLTGSCLLHCYFSPSREKNSYFSWINCPVALTIGSAACAQL